MNLLAVTHFYREREHQLAEICGAALGAVDLVVVCSNNPPAPANLPKGVVRFSSSRNVGTRLGVWASLAYGADVAVLVDDDVLLEPDMISRMVDRCVPGGAVTVDHCVMDGVLLANGRAMAVSRRVLEEFARHQGVLPGTWGDDLLLGALADPLTVVTAEGMVRLDECGVRLLDHDGYDADRVRNVAAIRAAGLFGAVL